MSRDDVTSSFTCIIRHTHLMPQLEALDAPTRKEVARETLEQLRARVPQCHINGVCNIWIVKVRQVARSAHQVLRQRAWLPTLRALEG